MEVTNDIYCPNCNYILEITKSIKDINKIEDTTPDTLSTENEELVKVDYETIIKKVQKGENPTNEELESIDIVDIIKDPYYKKLSNKGEIKKIILELIEDMGNADDNIQCYVFCKTCGYNKKMKNNFNVLVRKKDNLYDRKDKNIESNYRNKVHMRTMPSTRNFKCNNNECPSIKNKVSSEAIFFRKNSNSYETIYVCKRCLSIKRI
jgi:hypothetical protein